MDSSKLNKTYNNEEFLNLLNTNSHIITSTNNCSLNNNCTITNIKVINDSPTSLNSNDNHNKSLVNKYAQDMESNTNPKLKFLKGENTKKLPMSSNTNLSNELIDVNDLSKNNFSDDSNKLSNVINEIENNDISIDCVKRKKLNQPKEKYSNFTLKINNDLFEDNCNIESNSFMNDSNLSEKIIGSKNYSKPIKLNMVTTEPYPKYTPTVEKAIKKYENKQPKKECIVM